MYLANLPGSLLKKLTQYADNISVKKKYFLRLIVVIIALGISLEATISAATAPYITAPQTAVEAVESHDYATEVFGDPWDMSNSEDLSNTTGGFSSWAINDGMFSGTTNSVDASMWLLWGGYATAYAPIRYGISNPINANYYKRLTFRMYVDKVPNQLTRGQIYWFWTPGLKGNKGYWGFELFPGWHIYQIDLPSTWKGDVVSLRFDPTNLKNSDVKIDWIRLTNRPSANVELRWNDASQGTADVHLDNDAAGYDGSSLTSINSVAGANAANIDLDGLMPDSYYFYLQKGGSYSNYSIAPPKVNEAPLVTITDPDETGGRDWATTYLKNPWDMKNRGDVYRTFNIVGTGFGGGVFTGLNAFTRAPGSRKGDPYFMLNMGKGRVINASRFHRLTFRYRYQGGYALGTGTMSRFGWIAKRLNSYKHWQISDDVVTYSGWNTLTVDLKKIRIDKGKYGWKGGITKFRFDPHEDGKSRRFYVDYISLREDDRLSKYFDIKYNLKDSDNSSVNLNIYADRDRSFGNGNESLLTSLTTSPGNNQTWRWTPPASVKGTFWIYIAANDGLNSRGYYSTGPLKVH